MPSAMIASTKNEAPGGVPGAGPDVMHGALPSGPSMPHPAALVKSWLRALLGDGDPPAIPGDYRGPWAEEVLAVLSAHQAGGVDAARRAFDALARAHPGLATLVAGEPGPDDEGWQAFTLADAYAERPALRFAVEGLFALPSLSIVYGAPGNLKSFLMMDMAICVAAGQPWLPALPGLSDDTGKATTQVPVIWLDFDNGSRRMHERIGALGRAYGLPTTTPITYYSMPSPWLDASQPDSVGDLQRRIVAAGAGLCVIDCLGVILGAADENSPAMSNVMAILRRLSETTGAAVVVIHHQRKASGVKGRAGEALRGHSSIEAALDLALLAERDEGADIVTVKSTKTRDVAVPPFGAMFTYEHKPASLELLRARFYGVDVEDFTSDAAIEREIIGVLRTERTLSQSEIKCRVKALLPEVGVNRIRNVADRLVNARKLTATTGQHGMRLYALP